MEGCTRAFVKLRRETPLAEISDLIGSMGGRMHACFGEEPRERILGATVSVPDERLVDLRAYKPALRVYTGPIPRSTLCGYDRNARVVADQWNGHFKAAEPRYP